MWYIIWCVTLRDTGGKINIWKHRLREKSYRSPPAPNNGGAQTQSPPGYQERSNLWLPPF